MAVIDDLQHIMTFGKYRGENLAHVIANNASYALWAHDNVSRFKLSSRLLKAARDYATNQAIKHQADMAWGSNIDIDFDDPGDDEYWLNSDN